MTDKSEFDFFFGKPTVEMGAGDNIKANLKAVRDKFVADAERGYSLPVPIVASDTVIATASEYAEREQSDSYYERHGTARLKTPAERADMQRLRILRADPNLILEVLNWCRDTAEGRYIDLPKVEEIPDGCEVVSVNASWSSRSIELMLRHSSFDGVPDGSIPPTIEYVWRQAFRSVKNPKYVLEKVSDSK